MTDILNGKRWRCDCSDALTFLRGLPDGIARTCVTSPPYFGLRDYGTASWEGGDNGCDHVDDEKSAERKRQKKSMIAVGERIDGSTRTRVHDESIGKDWQYRGNCLKCGAVRVDNQIGLEPTPTEFVSKLVDVFREVRRVLRDDGTLWLNLGDSYANSGNLVPHSGQRADRDQTAMGFDRSHISMDVRPKNLLGIPWRVAFALQADGWYLRQDIIWHKPNPMPESVTDRCTKAHEYIFLLSKSPRYYFDAEAIQEPVTQSTIERVLQANWENQEGSRRANGGMKTNGTMKAVVKGKGGGACFGKQNIDATGTGSQQRQYDRPEYQTRNKRSVWTVGPASFKGAHFATFPAELITPCILAGSAVDDIVLEPFSGSGTTLATAVSLGRRALGCELNPKYMKLIRNRMSTVTAPIPGTV